MQDQLLEGLAPLRDDEQASGLPVCDEGFFHGMATGNELLILANEILRQWHGGRSKPARRLGLTRWIAPGTGAVVWPRGVSRAAGRSEEPGRFRGSGRLWSGRLGREVHAPLRRFRWGLAVRSGFGALISEAETAAFWPGGRSPVRAAEATRARAA